MTLTAQFLFPNSSPNKLYWIGPRWSRKGDLECAHLVLVSLSYLLDFLIAVDFLGCDKLKSSVEEKIKEKIDETNWREVLGYTKDIIGLENTTKAALEHIMKALVKFYTDIELDKDCEDPYIVDYCDMPANMVKLMFRSHSNTSDIVKMHLIKNWVRNNSFKENEVGVFELLRSVDYKELSDGQIKSVTDQVNSWPLSEEQFVMFSQMVETAKKERDELQDKRKKFRSNKFTTYQEWRENRRSFWSEMRLHLPGPPPPPQFFPLEELQFLEQEEMMMGGEMMMVNAQNGNLFLDNEDMMIEFGAEAGGPNLDLDNL